MVKAMHILQLLVLVGPALTPVAEDCFIAVCWICCFIFTVPMILFN